MRTNRFCRFARAAALVAVTFALRTGALAAQPDAWQSAINRLQTRIEQDVSRDSVGAITAAVVDRGAVAWVKGFGWADRDRKIPADANTIYRVGSITKSFTAVVLMQAVRNGQVQLDAAVERYLPEATQFPGRPEGSRPVTMRQLASHTGGLIREPQLLNAAAGPIEEWESRILASIPTTNYQSAPGERYSYSNIGYGVLGLATARAAGTPYMDLVRSGILEPLGMSSSGFILTPEMRAHLAVGYANGGNRTIDAATPAREHAGRGYKVPNGGLYSTAPDLARFIAAMSGMGGEILSTTSRAEMLRVQTPQGASGYGLGFMITNDASGVRIVEHGGSVSGYTAHIAFQPESGIGVILLRNYGSGATNLGATASATVRELLAARRSAARLVPTRSEPMVQGPAAGPFAPVWLLASDGTRSPLARSGTRR